MLANRLDATPSALLLDGHNRYRICHVYGLPHDVRVLVGEGREDAVGWIIAHQLGRRNLSEKERSYLIGKRYNAEKRKRGGDQKSKQAKAAKESMSENRTSNLREELAQEYGVAPSTVTDNADFAEDVDTLNAGLRDDMRDAVLQRQERAAKRATKKQVKEAAALVKAETAAQLAFLQRRDTWKPYQVLEALELLSTLPQSEYAQVNAILDQPFLPGVEGLLECDMAHHSPRLSGHPRG